MRRLTPRPRRDEKGAVIVMMTAFVLGMVGMAALVVDVGAMLDEKRQLQNGADAAALGLAQYIAQTCPVTASAACTSALQGKADQLAAGNARDGFAKVAPPTANHATQQVTVQTSTLGSGSDTILPHAFGQALSGVRGQTLKAAATATWAGLKTATVIPLTLSNSGFECATNNNTVFDVPQVILFHSQSTGACTPSGNTPGGFGWLKDTTPPASDCNITLSTGNTVQTDSGNPGTPGSCNLLSLVGTDILVPLFDLATCCGNNGTFHIYGFAQFHLTGYRFVASGGGTGGVVPCSPPSTCIGGKFIKFVGIGEYGGPNLGNRVALVS